jgi:hypothetical protein
VLGAVVPSASVAPEPGAIEAAGEAGCGLPESKCKLLLLEHAAEHTRTAIKAAVRTLCLRSICPDPLINAVARFTEKCRNALSF